ncbi:IclR family transcriptional regulator [Catenulispora yoronensis]|uniref:IclR family transcriptional regulator n=1 Tax=Catenulispora yoronensis TaxID=450799 RepID=A0ABN2U4Q4_9ACTN
MSTSEDRAPGGFSQSLERGLLILSAFTEHRPVLGIADLARAAGLTKSTAHRYVATLAKLGYVLQDPDTRKYSLGPRVIDLGFAALNSMEITRIAAQPLQALSDETGYPASMAVLDGADVVYVDRRRSRRATGFPMDITLHVGSRLPAYCTSMGKVLLADQDPEQLAALLDRSDLSRRGPKTITGREQLLAVLDRVRANGIAVNDEELAPGLRSVAAPVRDRSGAVVAAVNLAVHLTTWNAPVETVVVRLEGPLRATAAEISARLGWRPEPGR